MNRYLAALIAGSALALGACSQSAADADTDTAGVETSSRTLAALIADTGDYSTVAGAMKTSGLSDVFDGSAPYTVLVPTDEAFAALGADAELLAGEEQRAAMVAVLRDHIVPGSLTPQDISDAIDAAPEGSVTMTSMGDHDITFARSGDSITATSSDGSSARFAGDAMQAANGVAIPLDAVLKKI